MAKTDDLQPGISTRQFTAERLASFKLPPCQRNLQANAKVKALTEDIRASGGIIPGTIHLGIVGDEVYILDGQHRRAAFAATGLLTATVDVKIRPFKTLDSMAAEFVRLNSQLLRMRPDDTLRALEADYEAIRLIRQTCGFVGYDMIRKGPRADVLSMSVLLRCWFGSRPEVPVSSAPSAHHCATTLTMPEAKMCCDFLIEAEKAWGRYPEYARLWGALNLVLCMWLYRRLVTGAYSSKSPRLSKDEFKTCLMALSADKHYLDYLVGRNVNERDRSPAYLKIKELFAKRLTVTLGKRPKLPDPSWAQSHKTGRKTTPVSFEQESNV